MGFGFVRDEGEEDKEVGRWEPKIKHDFKDRLVYQDWNALSSGLRVQSVMTGTKGTITKLCDQWQEITIEWDNGNESHYSQKYLCNVIVI